MNIHVDVTYTAYEPGTGNVMAEGTIPIPGSDCWLAESTVRAMFSSLEVIIRGSRIIVGK